MPGGRPPKPNRLKELAGNPGKRPLNDAEPKYPEDDPRCPGWLDAIAREEWERVAPILVAQKMLTVGDKRTLEIYCKAYARWRQAEQMLDDINTLVLKTKSGYMQQAPWVSMAQKYSEIVLKLAGEFGFTPAARGRIRTKGAGEGGSEDDDFFNQNVPRSSAPPPSPFPPPPGKELKH